MNESQWKPTLLTALTLIFDWQIDAKALKIDDNAEDEHGGEQIGDVGQVLSIEGLAQRANFAVTRD